MVDEKSSPQPKVTINNGTYIGSQYAQLVNVSIDDLGITLEFVFVNPRNPEQSQVISRVTLPKVLGLKLPEMILTVNKFHEKKKGGQQDG